MALLKREQAISKLVGLLGKCSYLLGGTQQVWERRDGEKSPLCFGGETPGIETNETASVDYEPKLWFICWDQSLMQPPCSTACTHITDDVDGTFPKLLFRAKG